MDVLISVQPTKDLPQTSIVVAIPYALWGDERLPAAITRAVQLTWTAIANGHEPTPVALAIRDRDGG